MEKVSKKERQGCCRCHMNNLSSLCYCIMTLGLTAYIVTAEVQQLLKYLSLPWPDGVTPHLELKIHMGLVGGATILLPFFFCASVFKIGNFANDGFRLGVHDSGCSRDHPPLPLPSGGLLKRAWQHGGPTGPFIHLIFSHALLLARLVMEATVTRTGFLPKDTVWSSEMSFLLPQYERISLVNRLEVASSAVPISSGTGHLEDKYESSSSVVFSISQFGMEKMDQNKTTSTPSVSPLDPLKAKVDSWHIGEIPWGPFTPHFINYLLAHLVYAGRYAAVFWGTNKSLSFLFLLQMLLNATQNVLAINGFQVLYKVQVVGLSHPVLPVKDSFFLPFVASVVLYCASQTLVLASGCVIYLYGYAKFEAFLSTEREKYHILNKHGYRAMWAYWPHCWSLVVLVLMTGVASPLIYDWTIVYRASLDSASLVATCATITHLFVWILFWMALTLKSQWHFKLRVQVSKTIVTNTHSIRLVNEVQLSQQAEDSEGPLMIIGSGKTYLLQEESPKKAIMKLVLTTLAEKKTRGEEEEIYWLRPKGPLSEGSKWNKTKSSPGVKHKVTFHEDAAESSSGHKEKLNKKPSQRNSDSDSSNESDGDYARLSNVSFPGPVRHDISQDQKNTQKKSLSIPTSHEADSVSVGSEFPAPPPEMINPATHPPLPSSPPPPLPSDEVHLSLATSPASVSPVRVKAKNPVINIVRGDSGDGSMPPIRDSSTIGDCPDSSSTSSSVTPPDKRSDSGVHSQTSTGSHSKSGSSGSESCVPPPIQNPNTGHDNSDALPLPSQATSALSMVRCSSVDELCSVTPSPTVQNPAVKSYSLQHGAVPVASSAYQQQEKELHQMQHMQQNLGQQVQQYQQLQYEAHQERALQQQQSHNNNNSTSQQNNNERAMKQQQLFRVESTSPSVNDNNSTYSSRGRVNIEVVGGGYGFLPPAKFVASEPVYSDASTPVAIRRRSSITAVEPETPPYERSAASFSTFTEPQLPRAILRGPTAMHHVLSTGIPGKAMTVGASAYRSSPRPATVDAKHATITGAVLPKGFHQLGHADSRYFSVPAVKPQGIRIHPAPEPNSPFAHNLIHK